MNQNISGASDLQAIYVDNEKSVFKHRVYTIRDETTLCAALYDLIENKDKVKFCSAKFENLFFPNLVIQGEKYNATISYSAMSYYCELQQKIYSLYALAKYDTFDANKLTKEEKQKLEIFLSLGAGSSLLQYAQDYLDLFKGYLEDMTSTQKMILGLSVVAVVGGYFIYSGYLQHKQAVLKETNNHEINIEQNNLHKIIYSSLVAESVDNNDLNVIAKAGEKIFEKRLRLTTESDYTKIGSLKVEKEQATSLLSSPKIDAIDVQLNGYYTIIQANHNREDTHSLRVRCDRTTREFSVVLTDFIASPNLDELVNNEYSRTPIWLDINARIKEGKITKATVASIGKRDDDSERSD